MKRYLNPGPRLILQVVLLLALLWLAWPLPAWRYAALIFVTWTLWTRELLS